MRAVDSDLCVSACFLFFSAVLIVPNGLPQRPMPRRGDEFPLQWPRALRLCEQPRAEEQSNTAGATDGPAHLPRLEKLELEPTILDEQANKGRAIYQKFQDRSDVAFAIVLLTADDIGGKSSNPFLIRCKSR